MSIEKSTTYIGDELGLFASATNWKRYWGAQLEPLIGESILEVGAGIGNNLLLLRQPEQCWTALEPDAQQAKIIKTKLVDQQAPEKINIICGSLTSIKKEPQFDTIIYIDVLEHIEDDLGELEQAMKCLKQGGRLIVLSPAYQKLYSAFDEAVGHYRRYNKKTLEGLTPMRSKIETLFYLDSVGCLASFANKAFLKSTMPTKKQLWFWDKLMVPISRVCDVLIGFSFGKSIIAVWRKG